MHAETEPEFGFDELPRELVIKPVFGRLVVATPDDFNTGFDRSSYVAVFNPHDDDRKLSAAAAVLTRQADAQQTLEYWREIIELLKGHKGGMTSRQQVSDAVSNFYRWVMDRGQAGEGFALLLKLVTKILGHSHELPDLPC